LILITPALRKLNKNLSVFSPPGELHFSSGGLFFVALSPNRLRSIRFFWQCNLQTAARGASFRLEGKMKLRIFWAISLLVFMSLLLRPAFAQQHSAPGHSIKTPAELKWQEGPPSLPPGAQAAVLEGDPSKPGPFTIRFKIPANYKIPPHWHPKAEHVTVLDGALYMGLGEVFDESAAQKLPVGGFAVMQIGTRHFAFTKEATIIQLHGMGPWGIQYVRPEDDPRQKARP
jgi:quercetin dioxygenase-like cupin family protein